MVRRKVGTLVCAAAVAFMAVACSKSDPGVTTAVKSKLAADDTVKAYRIDVDTKEGVVTLAGNVDTPAARVRAVELATGTDGVVRVVDQLVVAPGAAATSGVADATRGAGEAAGDTARGAGQAVGDAAITTAVKTKFLADTKIGGLKIDIDTANGVVTLTGLVPTAAEKAHALEVARESAGVKSVVDKLRVGRPQ
jgi:hyperosmotically inducible protein